MPESTPDHRTDEPQVFEAATADEALVLVTEELGTDAEILGIERVTKGGIAGFFAREVVQVTARCGAPRPTARQRVAQLAADVIDDRPEPGVRTAGVDRVLEMLKGQVDAREETFAERLQARLEGDGHDGADPERSIDLTAFDHPSAQLSPAERVAAVRREAQRNRDAYGAAAAPGSTATMTPVQPDLPVVERSAPRTPDPVQQAAREQALRALILAEAAAQGVVPTVVEPTPAPAVAPALPATAVLRAPQATAEHQATADHEVPVEAAVADAPTAAEVRAVEDRAAAAIAALRAERGATEPAAGRRRTRSAAAAEPTPAAAAAAAEPTPAEPTPARAAPAVATVADAVAGAETVAEAGAVLAATEVRSPLWRRVSAAATDSHPGTGVVDWGVDALVHLGLPLAVVRSTFEVDPRDDLAWIEAVAGAVATYCRPLPGGPSVLAGPRADRIGTALGIEVTPFPEPPAYGGDVCLRTKDDGPGRAWISKVRGDRWLHVVAGGDWQDLVAKEPLAVSWVGPEALVPALQLCAAKGLVLGYGTSGTPGAPVTRAHPVEVALAVRSLVARR